MFSFWHLIRHWSDRTWERDTSCERARSRARHIHTEVESLVNTVTETWGRNKFATTYLPTSLWDQNSWLPTYEHAERRRSVLNFIPFYYLPLKARLWVQIPASAKPRRKTGGEDNHGGKRSLVCEVVGPHRRDIFDLVWAYPLHTNRQTFRNLE